jgi:hypothetical protein
VSFGAVGAQVKVGSIVIGGEARNFASGRRQLQGQDRASASS